MKKLLFFVCIFTMCIMTLAGCGTDSAEGSKKAKEESLKVVTTIYPLYDWARNIDPDADLIMLLDNGVDLHNFQPTADDILKICDADVFFYVGGESDEWVEGVMEQAGDKVKAVSLLDLLGGNVKAEELVEGMEAEEEEGEEEEPECDEHVWLSLKNASIAVNEMKKVFSEVNPSNTEVYQTNAAEYQKKITELEKKYSTFFDGVTNKTILFGDRFPFRYLADDYDLTYYAAFAGCSAETESSFETILFLAGKVDELNLKTVYVTETSDGKIAQTVIENTKNKDAKIVTINALQSITGDQKDQTTYLKLMEENLKAFQDSLN